MQGITKDFPGVRALDSVDFSCFAGEVHALVGENGAGKSTLMKILAGAYLPDEGKILLDSKQVQISSSRDAQKYGIGIIYQEFNLVPELDVAQNVFLGREPKRRCLVDRRRLHQRTEELLSNLGVAISPHQKVKNLSVAEQQMVEVAKALSLNANIIIMDEPSAAVSGEELESLFQIIRSLKQAGKLVIYISHRLDEIFEIADRVTVMKDGKIMQVANIEDLDKKKIISLMVGRTFDRVFPSKKLGPVGLRKEFLSLRNVCKGRALKNINLTLNSGEILGVAGLVGSGRTSLARVIFGADPIDRGEIYVQQEPVRKMTPRTAIAKGIGFVTEDRKKEGIVACLPVKSNLTFPILSRICRIFFVKTDQEETICENCLTEFNIKCTSTKQLIQYLSGGNQQKVIFARCINTQPKLIIMDEPTRGIDVGAKVEIYNLMRRLAEEGTGIMMISSELPEIIGLSDRVVVMREGEIAGELGACEDKEEAIMTFATRLIESFPRVGEGL